MRLRGIRALVSLALALASCSAPQVPPIPDEITAGLAAMGEPLLLFEGGGLHPMGAAAGRDGTAWFSFLDSSDRNSPVSWLVEVDSAGAIEYHGPLSHWFSDSLIVDDTGKVWMAAGHEGPNAERFGVWRFDGSDVILSTDALGDVGSVAAVATGPDDSIWAITESALLLRYQGDVWQTFPGPEGFMCPVHDCIKTLAIDDSGTAWVSGDMVPAPWLLRFDGDWSSLSRSDSPLTGAVEDIVAADDGSLWVLFDSEMVPTRRDPVEWCSSHVSRALGYPAFCSGGLAVLREGNWTVLDNYIPTVNSLVVSAAGDAYVWFEPANGQNAIRVVRESGVTQYDISLDDLVFGEIAVVGSSVWIIERRTPDEYKLDNRSDVYLTRYELSAAGKG